MDLTSQIDGLINKYKKRVADAQKEVLESVSKDIERNAKLNFRRAEWEVPADDPRVYVSRHIIGNNRAEIVCGGDQVLFIEFGAGVFHQNETKSVVVVGETETEIAPRPDGIVTPGNYGQHRGRGDSWHYNSMTGREARHTHLLRQSKEGLYAMRTGGIRPIRALWRARGLALKHLMRRKDK